MPDREKVIKGLECCLGVHDCDIDPKEECPYNGMALCAMCLKYDVMELLKAQEPRVMTLEEVKRHNNQDGCIWFEQPTYNAVASFAIQDEECTEIISPYILGEPINHGYWSNSNYNLAWRCWTSRPTNEHRKTAKWDEPPKEDEHGQA